MADVTPIRRALISVSDKRGLPALGRALAARGVEILSTGGTLEALRAAGVAATQVSAHTGAPEIMDGRVKTLHPKIHGGILGRRDLDADVMARHGIAPIDLVVVNLYPFSQTVAGGAGFAEAIENIDIGGPAMLRAAAKNQAFVTVVVDPDDYPALIDELGAHGGLAPASRARLAAQAFAHSAAYDAAVADYLTGQLAPPEEDAAASGQSSFPATLSLRYRHHQPLRYGENPHQAAAFYSEPQAPTGSLAQARQLQGKPLSYNNLADADAALACARAFDPAADGPACIIVKHANPCGVAIGSDLEAAYTRAFATDPTSAFGGIIACNMPLDTATARAITANQFAEVIVAPEVSDEALAVLARKKNLRVLVSGAPPAPQPGALAFKPVSGGLLVQQADSADYDPGTLAQASRRAPTAAERADLLFAWRVAKYVKSNAIVYARDGATVGIGAGQMSRVDSARIAALKAADAGLEVAGAVMASDAFFPFRDGVDAAAAAGVRAVIQPGGSIRDDEVVAAADAADMAMLFTGMRHFRH